MQEPISGDLSHYNADRDQIPSEALDPFRTQENTLDDVFIEDDTWVCTQCGSDKIEQQAWVRINTGEITEMPEDDYAWCADCLEHVNIVQYEFYNEQDPEDDEDL